MTKGISVSIQNKHMHTPVDCNMVDNSQGIGPAEGILTD